MVRGAKLPSLKETKKKRKRSRMSNITVKVTADTSQQVQRRVQVEGPTSGFSPLRECRFQRGARIIGHGDGDFRKRDFAGLIFMCNTSMKQDCFRYRIFGLPEAKKHLVERIRRGMTLFLFDVDLNSLHGIYKASSPGGFSLQADASRASSKIFPWQVRFTIYKDCAPLPENVFKTAIKDNYDGNRMFRIELTGKQVQKLVKLFQSPERDDADIASPGMAPSVPIFGPLIQSDAPPSIIHEHTFPVRYRYLHEQLENKGRAGSSHRPIIEPVFALQDRHRQDQVKQNMLAELPSRSLYDPTFAIQDRLVQEQMEKNMHADSPPSRRSAHESTFPAPDRHVRGHVERNMLADPLSRPICEPYFEPRVRSGYEMRLPRLPQKTTLHNPLIAKLTGPASIPSRESFPTHGADHILGGLELHKTYPCPVEVKLRSQYTQECVPARASFPTRNADPILGEVILHKTDSYPLEPVEEKLCSGYAQDCIPARTSFPTPGEDAILGGNKLCKTDSYPIGSAEMKLQPGYLEVGDWYRHRLQRGPDVQERVLDKRAQTLYPLATSSLVRAGVSSQALCKRPLDDAYLGSRALMLLSERGHVKEILPDSIACKSGLPY